MTTATIEDFTESQLKAKVEEVRASPSRRRYYVVNDDSINDESRPDHLLERNLIMRDAFDTLMLDWLREVYREPVILQELNRHVLPLFNPPKRAVNRLAVAYTNRPVRRVGKRKRDTDKWSDILRRSLFDLHMDQLNRDQVAYNTVVVLPRWRRSEDGEIAFDFERVTGAIGEVFVSGERSRFEAPDILFWRLSETPEQGPNAPVVRSVDAEWYAAYDSSGRLIPSETKRHGLGMFPGAVVRSRIPDDIGHPLDQWWDPWCNKGAFRCMRSVTRIVAAMDWTRKTQCRKIIAETVDDESKASGVVDEQILTDPEGRLRIRGEGARLDVHDLDQAVTNFKDHIRFLQDEALEVMTGAVASLGDPDPANPLEGAAAARSHSAIELHRKSQIDFLRPADLRLQRVIATMAQRLRVTDSVEPERIRDSAEVEYMPLPFIDDRKSRLDWYVLAAKFGIVDQVMAAVEFHGWTEEEALDRLKKMAERKAELRSLTDDAQAPGEDEALPGEGVAERQGRVGGQQRISPTSQAESAR